MSHVVTYADALAELDEAIDRAKDILCAELAAGCSDPEAYCRLMEKGRQDLAVAREQAVARLDAFWARVDALPDGTVH